ncbi:MAG: hypothetical protein MSG64_10850 [Pyrinomonadaceae bacterium MAG19_C2-C3]|nr:hypothetical protein [Pyrinomonadaceae bacterium MAG19_C2-C3]
MSGTGQQDAEKWTYGVRVISNTIDRAKWRNTLTYRFHPRFTAGVEYNPLAGKVSPLANVVALTETNRRPALIIGTSSDRIGTPFGQSFYATFSKNLRRETGLPVAPYIGVAYGTFEDRARIIGGLNINLNERWSSTILFDGVRVHPTVNYTRGRHQFGVIFERGRNPGASYSISF